MKIFVRTAVSVALPVKLKVWLRVEGRKLKNVNKKIEETVVGGYKKVEDTVVGGYKKIEDKFVDTYLTKENETVEEAKARLKKK